MQHVSAKRVAALLDYRTLIEALRLAHREGAMPDISWRVDGERDNPRNKFVQLHAWEPGAAIAVKLVGVFPGNLDRKPPEPSIQGLVILFDGETGAPLLTADGAEMTFRKTAADSALAADYLARRDARVLLVAGAGGLAPHVIAAHRAVRPSIERVLIWNRTPGRAEALAAGLRPSLDAQAVATMAEALPAADIVSCVTMATAPVVRGALLKEGAHVDLIGAYLPEMREADDDVARRAGAIFFDNRLGIEESGEVIEPLARGLITRKELVADLFDLCAGRHRGRQTERQITMYKNCGGAHLDLYTARCLRDLLAAAGQLVQTDTK